jgi:hypothetical protein
MTISRHKNARMQNVPTSDEIKAKWGMTVFEKLFKRSVIRKVTTMT